MSFVSAVENLTAFLAFPRVAAPSAKFCTNFCKGRALVHACSPPCLFAGSLPTGMAEDAVASSDVQ